MKELFFSNDIIEGYLENGISYGKFKVKVIDLETAKVAVASRIAISNGVAYPILADARHVSSITKEARDYFASTEGTGLMLASALLLDSVLNRFLGNFFLQINKPKIPLKLFTDENEALKWLEQYKSK